MRFKIISDGRLTGSLSENVWAAAALRTFPAVDRSSVAVGGSVGNGCIRPFQVVGLGSGDVVTACRRNDQLSTHPYIRLSQWRTDEHIVGALGLMVYEEDLGTNPYDVVIIDIPSGGSLSGKDVYEYWMHTRRASPQPIVYFVDDMSSAEHEKWQWQRGARFAHPDGGGYTRYWQRSAKAARELEWTLRSLFGLWAERTAQQVGDRSGQLADSIRGTVGLAPSHPFRPGNGRVNRTLVSGHIEIPPRKF